MRSAGPPTATFGQDCWRRFCRLAVSVFYRRCEVSGSANLPASGPLLLCANHVNALVDALVIQAACPRPIHPLARSGLFRVPIFRPILELIQAVPVYRRRPGEDAASDAAEDRKARNLDSFQRCYDYLGDGRVLLIFPEGQSHSDPRLRSLKSGAARLALGNLDANGELPAVVPVGLTFTHKGRFRSDVLVQCGKPVVLAEALAEEPVARAESDRSAGSPDHEAAVERLTERIGRGLETVTLNTDSWEDVTLLRLLQDFFTLRRGRSREDGTSLRARFRSFQRLIDAHRRLRLSHPDEVAALRRKLKRFERLRRRYGVRDYQLTLRYTPTVVAGFLLRAAAFVALVFPLALWGILNSALPYLATRQASLLTARGRDQYDTAGILFGLLFFLAFWGGQTFAVWWFSGLWPAVFYGASLPLTALVALRCASERRRILENVRVFLLFLRKRKVQGYLRRKREELEVDLARMARLARHELAISEGG